MRVLSVVGNRPQFIKSAPLTLALRTAGIDEIVVHTGQHWDPEMSQIFFDELGIDEPAYRLDLRTADTDAMTAAITSVVRTERLDWVLVYGDTNSTVAGARAADGVPIAHVEAGLRSFDLTMPEEGNRIEVDRRSALLLCPDERSAAQLEAEGVAGRIATVGDVMADATRLFAPIARERSTARGGEYTALTIHRQANTEPDRLRAISAALGDAGRRFVFPMHPRTRRALDANGIALPPNVEPIEPLGYLEMLGFVEGAEAVVTDSGGLQKEAYWLRVPCVTLRPNTEWVDTVTTGANALAEPDGLADALAAARFPDDAPPLYGDGHAAERITDALYA
ncbi:MAG TPA: UDP-N-acetyl glucosamine 2-epimerase [Gaiellaceae bacterium]|nr:UDP-N-acetyl glucosamine 2-epimerase [Gaiellaceae bacterium]